MHISIYILIYVSIYILIYVSIHRNTCICNLAYIYIPHMCIYRYMHMKAYYNMCVYMSKPDTPDTEGSAPTLEHDRRGSAEKYMICDHAKKSADVSVQFQHASRSAKVHLHTS